MASLAHLFFSMSSSGDVGMAARMGASTLGGRPGSGGLESDLQFVAATLVLLVLLMLAYSGGREIDRREKRQIHLANLEGKHLVPWRDETTDANQFQSEKPTRE